MTHRGPAATAEQLAVDHARTTVLTAIDEALDECQPDNSAWGNYDRLIQTQLTAIRDDLKARWEQPAAVLAWDWRDQPDPGTLAAILKPYGVHVARFDTGTDNYAIVISGRQLTEPQATQAYRDWLALAISEAFTYPESEPA